MNSGDTVRLGFFLLTFLLCVSWEILAPRRPLNFPRNSRWFNNIGMSLVNQLLLRLAFPILVVGVALQAQQSQWGLFNAIELPGLMALILGLLLLDLTIYVQHRVFHRVNWLWKIHRVHHTDLDFDVTTAVRFHPIEMVLSTLTKMAVVILLGVQPLAVLIFEIVLSLTSLFNHSNIFIPAGFDRVLRWGLVTPDMHRVHHSIEPGETNSNFGFNIPWWDHLFKTYRAQPRGGHGDMTLGLADFRRADKLRLVDLLRLPFR